MCGLAQKWGATKSSGSNMCKTKSLSKLPFWAVSHFVNKAILSHEPVSIRGMQIQVNV